MLYWSQSQQLGCAFFFRNRFVESLDLNSLHIGDKLNFLSNLKQSQNLGYNNMLCRAIVLKGKTTIETVITLFSDITMCCGTSIILKNPPHIQLGCDEYSA
jgi:hypothetical protein